MVPLLRIINFFFRLFFVIVFFFNIHFHLDDFSSRIIELFGGKKLNYVHLLAQIGQLVKNLIKIQAIDCLTIA